MGKCLITRLDGVVNNPSLLKVGEFKLNSLDSTAERYFEFLQTAEVRSASGADITWKGETYNKISVPNFALLKLKAGVDIMVKDDYMSTSLDLRVCDIDVTPLQYRTKLEQLILTNSNIWGDLESLGTLNNLKILHMNCDSIEKLCDVASFSTCTNLTEVFFSHKNFVGRIESFVEGLAANGKRGEVSCSFSHSNVTLNGNNLLDYSGRIIIDITGEKSAVITYNNATLATLSNGEWIY